MRNLFILFILSISFSNSFAQNNYTQTIRGTVIDKSSQSPLIGASIILMNSDPLIGTITDIEGKFRLENVPVGRQGITISYLGYNTIALPGLNLTSGKELVLTIELEENITSLSKVVITAEQRKDIAINEMATVSSKNFWIIAIAVVGGYMLYRNIHRN